LHQDICCFTTDTVLFSGWTSVQVEYTMYSLGCH